MIYLELFWSFIQIGALSFGGGYAAIPLIQSIIVENHGWLSITEFTDLITISQMTPGPIAINSATFVGLQIAGTGGAIVATIGNILPSFILVTFIAWLYMKYQSLDILQDVLSAMRPIVIGLIGTAGLDLLVTAFWGSAAITLTGINLFAVFCFILSIILLLKYKRDPIFVMILAGALNVLWAFVSGRI